MDDLVSRVGALTTALGVLCDEVYSREVLSDLSDEQIVLLLRESGRLQRRLEGLQAEATAQVRVRSEGMRDERMTSKYGCSRPADLLRMLLLIDGRSAHRLVRAAGFVRRYRGITDGVFLPAEYPMLREALLSGDLGVDGFLAAITPLDVSKPRVQDAHRWEADRQLGAFACGIDVTRDGVPVGPLPTPEDLGVLAKVLQAYVDPDGAEPSDGKAGLGRGLMIGVCQDGLVSVRGSLLPDVAAQFKLLLDSLLNPKVSGPPVPAGVHFAMANELDVAEGSGEFGGGESDRGLVLRGLYGQREFEPDESVPDQRSRAQKQHDVFAMILNVAARAGEFPDLGGAAPTLVVTATVKDYLSEAGWASLPNTGDLVPYRVAAQTACAGGVQRVLFDERGKIVSISTTGRIFNSYQRRAIIARDETCVIPGCTVPATWCEIHHVRDHARGGPTHTDNGAPVCWHHHRTLHLGEWEIRMNHGVPEIRGPSWWDPDRRWRPTTTRRARERVRNRAKEYVPDTHPARETVPVRPKIE